MSKLKGDAKAEYVNNLVGIIGWKIIMYVFQECEIREFTTSDRLSDSKNYSEQCFFLFCIWRRQITKPSTQLIKC